MSTHSAAVAGEEERAAGEEERAAAAAAAAVAAAALEATAGEAAERIVVAAAAKAALRPSIAAACKSCGIATRILRAGGKSGGTRTVSVALTPATKMCIRCPAARSLGMVTRSSEDGIQTAA